MNKNLPTPPSGRGGLQTSYGRPGGPGFLTYNRPTQPMRGPQEFALAAAVAGHNDPQQSIPRRRETQDQPRDMSGTYSPPRSDTPVLTETPSRPLRETGFGRPGGPRAVGPPIAPSAVAPAPGGVQTDHTGYQPYAGREVAMVRMSGPAIAVTADSDTNPGVGGLQLGHDGPVARSGNFREDFTPGEGTSAAEGVSTRRAVRDLVRRNGGMPAETESPMSRMRAGGLRNTMQSHEAGPGGLGVSPPGANTGQGFESHDGPADGSGPEKY